MAIAFCKTRSTDHFTPLRYAIVPSIILLSLGRSLNCAAWSVRWSVACTRFYVIWDNYDTKLYIGNWRSILQIILMQCGRFQLCYFFFLIFIFISGTFITSGTLSGTQIQIRDDPGKSGTYGMWRRIAALPHKRIQSRLCGDFPRINVVNTCMRRRSTHKAKIAFMRRNGAFLLHKEVER